MTAKRKATPKKTRFEVFKRDSFTCQYCGRKAPDVVLVADHIHPVAKGGQTDVMNLVTSCEECNQGKSDRQLTDSTVLSKRHNQSSALQQRREQIEMIADWQRGLVSIESDALAAALEYHRQLVPGWFLNETGKAKLRFFIAKYGLAEVMTAFRVSAASHLRLNDGKATQESAEIIGRVALNALKYKESNERDPEQASARYSAGIARNKYSSVPWDHREKCIWWVRAGIPTEVLREMVTMNRSWHGLVSNAEEYLEACNAG